VNHTIFLIENLSISFEVFHKWRQLWRDIKFFGACKSVIDEKEVTFFMENLTIKFIFKEKT
jgi:hypothetical protein